MWLTTAHKKEIIQIEKRNLLENEKPGKASRHGLQCFLGYEGSLAKRKTENERQDVFEAFSDDYKAYNYVSFHYMYNLAGDFY